MKKILLFALCIFVASSTFAQLKIGGKSINTSKALQATSDAATAATLSDADVAKMCKEAVDWMDKHNPIADETTDYGKRLARLTANLKDVNGLPLNFKVYRVIDINAFACGDGSVRVFSSLMDIMDDDELMAIIGHEIGHVAHSDSKNAMKRAYATSAAVNAAGAVSNKAAKLSDSDMGKLTEALLNAQFSQKQEYAADEYGFNICVKNGFSPYGMANSLKKLVELSKGEKASAVQQMFSTHPDSEKRAVKMKAKADAYSKK